MRSHHKRSFADPRPVVDDSWRDRTLRKGLKILVVEDEPELRNSLKRIFARFDCRVIDAADGPQGLDAALKHEPDLIISDFDMPGFNGYEMIRRMRETSGLTNVPVIMLTGSPRAFNLGESLEHELVALLRKPTGATTLAEVAARSLGGQFPLRAAGELADFEEDAERQRAADSGKVEAELQSLLGAHARAASYDFEADKPVEAHELSAADTAPIIKLVGAIMSLAVEKKASDVHIEPQENVVRVRFRIDGGLVPKLEVPIKMSSAIVARLKVMASLNIAERRVPQDGRFRMRLEGGRKIEVRVSTLPSRYGEKVVMRLLGQVRLSGDLNSLRAQPRDIDCMQTALANPNGLILVTGPTGSGKTSTLYTMLSALNNPDRNIVTAEDPVEYELPGITQVNVRHEIGFTFEKALRAFLRQDPDIILVGEIRDGETATTALKAAATGHLVLSTLHTNDAASSISRLVQIGAPAYMVAAAVRLVVAQRLVRTLCPHCKTAWDPTDSQRRYLRKEEAQRLNAIYAAKGCEQCDGMGYKGRTAVMEVLPVRTVAMRESIVRGLGPDALQALAVTEGMRPLRRSALDLVERGETSLAEALKIIVDE